jgi:hypothetical protein
MKPALPHATCPLILPLAPGPLPLVQILLAIWAYLYYLRIQSGTDPIPSTPFPSGAVIPKEMIEKKIYLIRIQKVMLDRDLIELWRRNTHAQAGRP